MKIDCSITENYFKEKARMIKATKTKHGIKVCQVECKDCCLSERNNGRELVCSLLEIFYPNESINIVQQWSDKHPQKTYKEDFFEKLPSAEKGVRGYPRIGCPCRIYPQLKSTCGDSIYCSDCWDKLMEG